MLVAGDDGLAIQMVLGELARDLSEPPPPLRVRRQLDDGLAMASASPGATRMPQRRVAAASSPPSAWAMSGLPLAKIPPSLEGRANVSASARCGSR